MGRQPRIEVYTKTFCSYCDRAKSLLESKGVEYEEYNVSNDASLFQEMIERADSRRTAPQVFIDDELIGGWDELSALDAAGGLDELLDSTPDTPDEHRPLIIAGTGIAGLTAAIYAARANNRPLIIEGPEPGGQLTLTTDVANYPGFPDGISGPELIQQMKSQAQRFGAEFVNGVITALDADVRPFSITMKNGDVYHADAFIAASGASARTLRVPGESDLMGYGVSTCATCDGAFFRDEEMLVVGGGDAAMEEANFLTKFAEKVIVVHRRDEFRAEEYWIDRTMEKVESGEIELLMNTEVTEIHGSPEAGVERVSLVRHPDGHPFEKLDDPETERFDIDVGAFFIAIGHTPNTGYLQGTGIEVDQEGYIRTQGGTGADQTTTDVPGIFGAGDVVDYHYQQAITAGGMGCMAAMDADDYLDELARSDRQTRSASTVKADD